MNVEALIPRWLRKDEGEWPMPDDVIVPPPIAMIPRAPETDEEKRLAAIAQAHVYVEQMRHERAATLAENEQLRADLRSEKQKSGLLELDVAERDNTIATLQSEVLALKAELEKYRTFFSVQKEINEKERQTYERFGIEAPPKKERTPRPKKKADRESTTETAKADG